MNIFDMTTPVDLTLRSTLSLPVMSSEDFLCFNLSLYVQKLPALASQTMFAIFLLRFFMLKCNLKNGK